jgi:hypothetical protein
MKTYNSTLIIAGVVIVAGCAIHDQQSAADPKTKYIVKFDTPALLVDKAKFITALNKASWRRGITFTPKEPGDPIPDHDQAPLTSSVTNTLVLAQNSTVNPTSLHVTQHVGFNRGQEKDLEALLKQVHQ